jgi:hypothetical protein
MVCGRKHTRKVVIKNNKGYKSICSHDKGKTVILTKTLEIQMIKMGKFIPGLFSDISATFTKTKKNKY